MSNRRSLSTLVIALFVLPTISGNTPLAPAPLVLGPTTPPAEYVLVREFLDERLGEDDARNHTLARVILDEGRKAQLAPHLLLGLIHVESSGRTDAISHAGALGLMQLRPPTARAAADELGIAWQGPATLFDPVLNVRMGIHYLSQLVDRFEDLDTALAAYNWGPTRIARVLRHGRAVPVRYTRSVHDASRAMI